MYVKLVTKRIHQLKNVISYVLDTNIERPLPTPARIVASSV